jgi:hypothetical protein
MVAGAAIFVLALVWRQRGLLQAPALILGPWLLSGTTCRQAGRGSASAEDAV